MTDQGSIALSIGPDSRPFSSRFSIGDCFTCEFFDDGQYRGSTKSLFGISETEEGTHLVCSNLTLDPNRVEKSAVDIHVTNIDPEYIQIILNCVHNYIETGEESSVETGYIQGTHTDEEGERKIIRLSITVNNLGIDISSVDEDGTDILDYARIPTKQEFRDGRLDDPDHLERFCSLCQIFLSATDGTGDIFETANYYVNGDGHFLPTLGDRCLSTFPEGDLEQAIRAAGTLLEEEVAEMFPDIAAENSPAGLMKRVFVPDDPELAWGYDGGEQEGLMFLYAGAIQALRNPMSHRHPEPSRNRYLDDLDRKTAIDLLCFFNFLLTRLDRYSGEHLDRQD